MKLDKYYTPNEIVKMVEPHLSIEDDDILFEPCVGTGQIPANLKPNNHWLSNDIDKEYNNLYDNFKDATQESMWNMVVTNTEESGHLEPIDWTITNPPFCNALPILKNAIKYSNKGVAFLVRLTFLEPTKDRYEFFVENPPTGMVVCPRPVFLTPNGYSEEQDTKYRYDDKYNKYHDNASCVWLIWDKSKQPMDINWYAKPKEYNWKADK